jgi:prepilin-type N-terminal cleavage/methylation domain-containing protein
MISLRDERGFTLIELLVAMVISFIVMGSVVTVLTVFLNDNRNDQYRDQATADSQVMIDRLGRDLRSAASPTPGSSGLLAEAGAYDIGFQSVNATPGTAPSGNATNQMWVRYCLDANNTVWRQTTAPSNTTSTFPDALTTVSKVPVDSAPCPSTNSQWITTSSGASCCIELNDVTNTIGGDNRPLLTYGPSGYQDNNYDTSQIKSVEVDLFVDKNPGHLPGPTELTSGIYLRNELAAPQAAFVPNKIAQSGGADVQLNGSSSSDPNGQVLSYQWYEGSTCVSPTQAPSSGAIAGATTQQYDAGVQPNGSYVFSLVVTNTGGLSSCTSQVVTVP